MKNIAFWAERPCTGHHRAPPLQRGGSSPSFYTIALITNIAMLAAPSPHSQDPHNKRARSQVVRSHSYRIMIDLPSYLL